MSPPDPVDGGAPVASGATTGMRGTPFAVDLSEDWQDRIVWVVLLAGPVIWFAHFMLVYLIAEAGCTGGGPGLEAFDSPVPRAVTLAATAVGAVACVLVGAWGYRRWRADSRPADGDPDLSGDPSDGSGRGPLAFSGVLLSALSAVAILFVGVSRAHAGVLTSLLAHSGLAPAPHDLWGAWNLDPLLVGGLVVAAGAYWRGRSPGPGREVDAWRARCFAGALVAIAVALVSPLDALSSALASGHMVQHVLLVLVAAPLLALSAPSVRLLRGSPPEMRRAGHRWRRRIGLTRSTLRPLHDPVTVWLLHVATLWFWHAAVPYDAALESEPLHILEHASFLITALLFWRVVIGTRAAGRVSNGFGALLVFAMALQCVFLSALLTFAGTPWYSGYAASTDAWSLDPLADQQLAGVIMWIPAGLVYVGAALALVVTWIRATELEEFAF